MTDFLKLQKEYKIHVYETGVDGKLNLASLFNFLQDIASEHAEILGFGRDDLMKHNNFWALSRMYAEISAWPSWGESIIITTYPNGTDKLFALRNYEVSYPDGRDIALATSSWLILDQSTRRIQRPEAALSHFNRPSEMQASPLRYASKLEFADNDVKNSDPFKVKISDLDINLHTNNVKYFQWINDSYDIDFIKQNIIHSTEINYLSELFYNDEVFLQTRVGNDSYYNHSVMRTDGKEVCRVRLGWKKVINA
jgi:acyl-ACP thioesterase